MSNYRFGTYFKTKTLEDGKVLRSKIVIGSDTKESEVKKFIEDLDEGTKDKILQGNSEGSYREKARIEERRRKYQNSVNEEKVASKTRKSKKKSK